MNGPLLALLAWLVAPAVGGPASPTAVVTRVGPGAWTTDAGAVLPSDAELIARGAVIGDVIVIAGDVFDPDDPEEDRLLFRVANRLHRSTRPYVVERQLLFAEGDAYDPRLLAESERLLRSNRYLHDAVIRPVRVRGNRVDVEVVTRDVWTLTGGASFGRSGGENTSRFEVQDVGFLGTGKDVTIQQESDVDRTSTLLRYRDPAIRGTRWTLEAVYSDNSDGFERKLYLERPFYSLETRWAISFRSIFEDRVDNLYDDGVVKKRLAHERDWVEAWIGRSGGLDGDRVSRWSFGATFARDTFGTVAKDYPFPGRPPTDEGPGFGFPSTGGPVEGVTPRSPDDRRLFVPWVAFEWIADDYVEARDVDRIGRTEDRHLGLRVDFRLGVAAKGFGSDRDAAIVRGALRDAFRLAPDQLVEIELGVGGRYRFQDAEEGLENFLASAVARYTWRNFGQHLFVARLGADWAENLDVERQLLLGGDNGLRGYPLRYQDGDRRVLLTLEQRFFTGWQVLKLFDVGAAVFADLGRAWFADAATGPEPRWLRDVGVGLRVASNRARGTMIHFDAAFPLDGNGSIDDVQWLITTHDTF